MSVALEVRALRSSAGLSRASHVIAVEVGGPDAAKLLQSACAQSPHQREGKVRQTLLLRENGSVFADVFVVGVADRFLVLAEGPDERALVDWLDGLCDRLPGARAWVRSKQADWAIFGIDGPYAWEVASAVLGPSVLGLPYLSLLARDEVLCVRAGKTGEYGYLLLVPRGAADSFEDWVLTLGHALDVKLVGPEALDVCALESGHFTMRVLRDLELATRLTPIELQLSWRVTSTRDFVGAEALRQRRTEGATVRSTCFLADGPVLPGHRVSMAGLDLGEVLAAAPSPMLGQTVGLALLSCTVAHPHLDFSAVAEAGSLPLRTCPAFLYENLSLRVAPHRGHTYATRGERS